MKKWSSALLPLSILLVLVALTAWLRYATEFPGTDREMARIVMIRTSSSAIPGDSKLDASGSCSTR
ncbi:MAG: hypothetical protein V5B44_24450 [Candidatus Accumulibacter necessarius]|jgi:PDZ domain-containing secreted protein|uniref:hypothetical protein n=1 Tax=Candidatus Accumulibacter necessarius TaxID=2954386 RepID=UPI002FC30355